MTTSKGTTISFDVPDATVARQYVSQLQSLAKQQNMSITEISVQPHTQTDYQSLQQESKSQSWQDANVTLLPFSN